MKISVVTPTIRPQGLQITQNGLQAQTFNDFEWLVEVGIPGRGHDLNAAYNRMLKRAKGELVVSLQDFIKIPPDYLQKFWDAYQEHPRTFFTAPVGKVDNLDFNPPAKWDWRAWSEKAVPPDTKYLPGKWDCWEIDSGSAPLAALKEIGGFDEELDKAWSSDNVNVACRADIAGYEFKNLFHNPALAYDHDAFMPHPFREKYKPSLNTQRMAMFRGGMTISYL